MVDLKEQYKSLRTEIEKGIRVVLNSTHFILGPVGRELEEEIAAYCGTRHAIGVASGTDALHLAVRALDIGPGDEVITTPFTFIATAEAIIYVGATPVFVDINPGTFNMNPDLLESAITDNTRAVIPVHMFGQPVDMEPIVELCENRGIRIVEDCAQAFGALLRNRVVGSIGDTGCFSFFPSKNLGCYGDGGMITTDSDQLAQRILALRNHGSSQRYIHSEVGYNSRLDEIQAVVLRAKLKHIEKYNSLRRENASLYDARFLGSAVVTPVVMGNCTPVYHQYTIMVNNREAVQNALNDNGIASAVYYPIPLHRQEAFASLCAGVNMPETQMVAEKVLSLPMYPELKPAQIDRICDVVLQIAE
jgi:dTDP-4-amino-4,6-dideoxygalactose transaminase